MLATASTKGTLVRLFDTSNGNQITEVRRGADPANIMDLTIDPSNSYVACSSDKGTIHVFATGADGKNKQSKLGMLSGAISYFGSSWSFS